MRKENIIQEKTYKFSIKIVNLYKYLVSKKKEYVLSKQLLKSGTSIGANIEESLGSQSRRGFYARNFIAYREARETKYWLKVLKDTNFIGKNTSEEILDDIDEICRILGRILKTTKNKSNW
jgi:four helix bundle protein